MKTFRQFEKLNNREGSLITHEDILLSIKNNFLVEFEYQNKTLESIPNSIDNDGLITFLIDGDVIETEIKNVIEIKNL